METLLAKYADKETTIAYFYCARTDQERERSDPQVALQCILRQQLTLSSSADLQKSICERHQQRVKKGTLSADDIIDMIIRLCNKQNITFLCVDALDECDAQNRHLLLGAFGKILGESTSLVKIFVSSRNDTDISQLLAGYPNLRIDTASNQNDITRYVKLELQKLIETKKILPTEGLPEDLRDEIIGALSAGSQGM